MSYQRAGGGLVLEDARTSSTSVFQKPTSLDKAISVERELTAEDVRFSDRLFL